MSVLASGCCTGSRAVPVQTSYATVDGLSACGVSTSSSPAVCDNRGWHKLAERSSPGEGVVLHR